MTTVTLQPPATTGAEPRPRLWAIIAVILAGEILDLLDSLVTIVAGPSILKDFGGTQTLVQWLSAGYTVAMAAGLLVGGRLGDMFGRKRMFLVGLAGFTTTSLISAMAGNAETLITARVLQGLLGALMVPQALGIVKEVFPPKMLGVALGITGPVMALSGVAGPIVAGWLVDANYFDLGWRMIFVINLPIGVATLVAGLLLLPKSRPQKGLTLDVTGAALASTGVAALVFALVQGRDFGWPWWIFAVMAGALTALAGFAKHQSARDARGSSTLVVPSLFGKKAFIAGLSVGALFFSALMGLSLLFSLYFQIGLGLSPLKAALASLPQAIGVIAGFGASQALGMVRRTMLTGLATILVGIVAAMTAINLQGDTVNAWWLSPALAILGIGMGMALAPFFGMVLAGVDETETGSASGSLTAVQQVGNALGVSLLGAVFFAALDTHRVLDGPAFASASTYALGAAIALVVVAFLLTLLLPKVAVENSDAAH
jgi:EmrB/QacA subfamily drug resistance transporter